MWLQATSSALLVLPIGHPGFCNYFFFFWLKRKKGNPQMLASSTGEKNYRAQNSKAFQGYHQSNWTLDVLEGGHILSKPNSTERGISYKIKWQKWGREGRSDIKAFHQILCEQQQCFGLICSSCTYKTQWPCFPLPLALTLVSQI